MVALLCVKRLIHSHFQYWRRIARAVASDTRGVSGKTFFEAQPSGRFVKDHHIDGFLRYRADFARHVG
jgi:hypothetical protein